MRTATRGVMAGLLAVAAAAALLGGEAAHTISAQPRAQTSQSDFERWMTELSNWGRWGKDDDRGALNLITPAKRKAALALVREDVSVSLARDVEKEKAADNPRPFEHVMLSPGMDSLAVAYHGYAHTHLDALCHMAYQGKMYNGFSRDAVTCADKLNVHNVKQGIVTRGVLVDIARLKGLPYLEPGTAIYPEDLEAWEKQAGVKVGSGDAVFIRTGRWARRAAVGPWNVGQNAAGLHASCARWLKQRDVAFLGSDAGAEVSPSGIGGVTLPIHQLALVALGVHIFDNCDLEALGEAAATRKRWEFLLTASPLAVTGGTGSPINPIATF